MVLEKKKVWKASPKLGFSVLFGTSQSEENFLFDQRGPKLVVLVAVGLSSLLLLLLTKNTRFAKLWHLLERARARSFHNSLFFFFPSTTHWSTKLTYPIPIYIGKPLHLKIHCDGMGVVIATGFGFLCTRCIKALTAVISVFDGSPPPPSAIAVCCIWQKWPLKWLQEAVSGVVLTV